MTLAFVVFVDSTMYSATGNGKWGNQRRGHNGELLFRQRKCGSSARTVSFQKDDRFWWLYDVYLHIKLIAVEIGIFPAMKNWYLILGIQPRPLAFATSALHCCDLRFIPWILLTSPKNRNLKGRMWNWNERVEYWQESSDFTFKQEVWVLFLVLGTNFSLLANFKVFICTIFRYLIIFDLIEFMNGENCWRITFWSYTMDEIAWASSRQLRITYESANLQHSCPAIRQNTPSVNATSTVHLVFPNWMPPKEIYGIGQPT